MLWEFSRALLLILNDLTENTEYIFNRATSLKWVDVRNKYLYNGNGEYLIRGKTERNPVTQSYRVLLSL